MRNLLFILGISLVSAQLVAAEFKTLCVVRELEDVDVPAKRNGSLENLLVRRGVLVSKGQLIAQLDKTDMQLRLNVAEAELAQAQVRAENNGPVASSAAAVKRAEQESRLLNELGKHAVYLERFRMENTLERSNADLASARNQLRQDQLQVDVKHHQTMLLQNDIKQTDVHSPVQGIIREVLKQQAEWVNQGEPIVSVIRMDRLLVEGFLDSKAIAPHNAVGSEAHVTIQLSETETAEFDGLVVRHSAPKLEIDGKFPVWVEINNRLVAAATGEDRWLVRPGMRGQMTIVTNEIESI